MLEREHINITPHSLTNIWKHLSLAEAEFYKDMYVIVEKGYVIIKKLIENQDNLDALLYDISDQRQEYLQTQQYFT